MCLMKIIFFFFQENLFQKEIHHMISETCVVVFKNLSKYISFYCVIFLTRRAVYTYNLSFTSVFVHCTYVCIKTLMSVKIDLNFDNDI